MAITPTGLPAVRGLTSPGQIQSPGNVVTKKPDDASFQNTIRGLLEKANKPHVDADVAFSDLVSGKTDNLHNVVLSVAKADMSFRLLLELRNRLTEAYQEIMRMQV
jgi:flagellar hook-basal body complex protein FliE